MAKKLGAHVGDDIGADIGGEIVTEPGEQDISQIDTDQKEAEVDDFAKIVGGIGLFGQRRNEVINQILNRAGENQSQSGQESHHQKGEQLQMPVRFEISPKPAKLLHNGGRLSSRGNICWRQSGRLAGQGPISVSLFYPPSSSPRGRDSLPPGQMKE